MIIERGNKSAGGRKEAGEKSKTKSKEKKSEKILFKIKTAYGGVRTQNPLLDHFHFLCIVYKLYSELSQFEHTSMLPCFRVFSTLTLSVQANKLPFPFYLYQNEDDETTIKTSSLLT